MRKIAKLYLLLLITLLIYSCEANKEKNYNKADKILHDFTNENIKDTREELFKVDIRAKDYDIILAGVVENEEKKRELLSDYKSAKINFIDSIRVVPDSVIGEKQWGLINLSAANIRSQPKHSAELATQAIMGTPVKVFDTQDSWYLIQTPDQYIAWVDNAGIYLMTEEELIQWQNTQRVIVIKDQQNIINKNGEVISDITMGSILEKVGEYGDRYQVKFPDGREGLIFKENAVDFNQWQEQTHLEAKNVELEARKLLGRPYLWGGTSTKAMDCSGFSKTVYFKNGVILPRDASLQFRKGDTINPEDGYQSLQKGDLIFFGGYDSINHHSRVTHVGIYLEDGEFIHAAGRVKINSFNPKAENYSNYRTISWLGGRRFIDSDFKTQNINVANHPWY